MGESKFKSVTVFGYPLSIFFIVVNEFCERFSFYGMKAVLVLYFKYFFKWDDDFATTIYHTFVALCFLAPIFGAIVADSWLGKFKTIIYLSIVYAIGQVILAVSAIHDITDTNRDGTPDNLPLHIALSMVGLLLIAFGTGGIKPCVAAFGGDQFTDEQEKQRSSFFSIFYMSVNAGSLLSTIITPILRSQECGIHTQRQCFTLAFGVPAALMVVSIIVFIVGSGMYTKVDPEGNILVKVCKCIGFAVKNRFRHRASKYHKREHWMDWAEEKYDKLLIAQVKMVLKVLFLYIPLPMFWALFDQQGSRWTLQATTMNGDFGVFIVQPDQMQTVNPILILILVPIMDLVVYPLVAKCNLDFSPLKRITVGMFFAALAFVAAAVVQLQINESLPKFPTSEEYQAKFINMMSTPLSGSAGQIPLNIEPYQATPEYHTFTDPFTLTLGNTAYPVSQVEGTRDTFVIVQGTTAPIPLQFNDIIVKPEEGKNAIRFFNGLGISLNITTVKEDYGVIVPSNMSEYKNIQQGNAKFTIIDTASLQQCVYEQTLEFGSSYTLIIPPSFTFGENCQGVRPFMDISPNTFHMAWQIPQYFLMTFGEVVFSVTGLQFSYSQAPSNMKSVLQAGWLFTIAVGNIIVLIVAEAGTLPDQWAEYVLFASLLVLVCIIFSVMAYFYTYMDPAKIEAQFSQPDDDKKRKSLEMVKRDSVDSQNEKRRRSDASNDRENPYQTKM